MTLEVEQGRSYFVDTRLFCENGAARAHLQLVDESVGKTQVLHSNLANITLFGIPLLDNDVVVADCSVMTGQL